MNKQTGINFIAQVIAFAINFCVSFFLTPFIIENIGVEANGFVSLANNFIEYAQLLTIAINSMAGRFITIEIHRKQHKEANKYFTSVFFANLFLSAILTVVFSVIVLFMDRFLNITETSVGDVKLLWALIFLNFIVTLFSSVFQVSTFVTDRLDKSAICSARSVVLKAAVLVICYSFFRPYTFYVGLAMLLMGIHNLISNIFYKRSLTPQLKIEKSSFDIQYIKKLFAAGMWNSISKLSGILSSGLDLLITNLLVSSVAMGVLTVPKTVSNIILLLFSNLAAIFAPQLTMAYARNDREDMKIKLVSSVKLMGLLSSIPIAVLVGFGRDFYSLWVPTQDAGLLQLLTLITCAYLVFELPFGPVYEVFTVSNKIKISSISLVSFSTASILTVFTGLNFINGEREKIIFIAAVGSFYNIVRLTTFLPIYAAKCLGLKKTALYPLILKNVLSVVILLAVSIAFSSLVGAESWLKLIICCALVCIIGLATNTLVLFSRTEISDMISKIKVKISK